jgi:hypothetical protein
MQCYECAKAGKDQQAVATCTWCSAGMCMSHAVKQPRFMTPPPGCVARTTRASGRPRATEYRAASA